MTHIKQSAKRAFKNNKIPLDWFDLTWKEIKEMDNRLKDLSRRIPRTNVKGIGKVYADAGTYGTTNPKLRKWEKKKPVVDFKALGKTVPGQVPDSRFEHTLTDEEITE